MGDCSSDSCAVTTTSVSPYRTVTLPETCFAYLPVSMTSSRPPKVREYLFPAGTFTLTPLIPYYSWGRPIVGPHSITCGVLRRQRQIRSKTPLYENVRGISLPRTHGS